MRFIYSFLFYLFLPFILLSLLWKSRRLLAYRERISERLMCQKINTHKKVDVWIHAASLGEVNAVISLAEEFLTKDWKLLITTTTPTGSLRVQDYFGSRVLHQYIPYDLPINLRRFYKIYSPKVGIIVETELWPNLIAEASKARVALFLVNARISPSAFKSYKRISWFLQPYLNMFIGILTQSSAETERFIQLGVEANKIATVGNLKFDIKPRVGIHKNDRLIICAASTHEGEEEALLKAFHEFKSKYPTAILILAPRHPERFQLVYELCFQESFKTLYGSDITDPFPEDLEVLVVNSIGELMYYYSYANYAFVGGSLVPVGGHNVLEPISLGLPVFSGPNIANFKVIVNTLLEHEGMQIISDANAFFAAVDKMQHNPELKLSQVTAAFEVLHMHQGAVKRCVSRVEDGMLGQGPTN